MSLTLVAPRKGRSTNYRIRGTVRGIPVDETTGTSDKTLADAIRIKRAAQLLEESVLGPRVGRRFSEAALGYCEKVQPGVSQFEAIMGRTRRNGTLSPCLVSDLGTYLCSQITQDVVDGVIRKRFADSSPATVVRSFLTPLIAVLTWASKREWCSPPKFERPAQPRPRSMWLDYDQADRLLAACSPHLYRLVLFLLLSGARLGEALSLKWVDVDLGQGWAVFRNTKRGKRGGRDGEDRGIPLHPQLVVMLANLRRPMGQEHVFLSPHDEPYFEGGSPIKTAWKATLARAGLDPELHVHDLRHTFATWLLLARVSEQVRDEIMGHASSAMGRRYAHVPRPEAVEAVQTLPSRVKSVEQAFPYPGKSNENKRVG